MNKKQMIQRFIIGALIGILPVIIWGFTVSMWQWWAITIPALIIMMCLMEAIQKPYNNHFNDEDNRYDNEDYKKHGRAT